MLLIKDAARDADEVEEEKQKTAGALPLNRQVSSERCDEARTFASPKSSLAEWVRSLL
jgi:hypothetical protein